MYRKYIVSATKQQRCHATWASTMSLTVVRSAHGGLVAGQIVLLADELVVVQNVQLLPRRKLLPTHQAGETVQVKHFVARLPHQIARRYALAAAAALRPVPPENN